MPSTNEQSSQWLIGDEVLNVLSGFTTGTVRLLDPYFETHGILKRVEINQDSLVLRIDNLERKRRFSQDKYKMFHLSETSIQIRSDTIVTRIEKGKRVYVAMWPSVNSLYISH